MTNRPGLDFSFSGLKTAALTLVRKHQPLDDGRAAIAPRIPGGRGGYATDQVGAPSRPLAIRAW